MPSTAVTNRSGRRGADSGANPHDPPGVSSTYDHLRARRDLHRLFRTIARAGRKRQNQAAGERQSSPAQRRENRANPRRCCVSAPLWSDGTVARRSLLGTRTKRAWSGGLGTYRGQVENAPELRTATMLEEAFSLIPKTAGNSRVRMGAASRSGQFPMAASPHAFHTKEGPRRWFSPRAGARYLWSTSSPRS